MLSALRIILQKDGEWLVTPRLHGHGWPDRLRYASGGNRTDRHGNLKRLLLRRYLEASVAQS
jgi:hypothetical protein